MFAVIKSILTLSCYSVICLSSLVAHAAPRLVTPKLPPGIQGQVYAASLLIGSALPLSSASVAGLPGGLTATHNGVGSIAISGTPTVSGNFALNVAAADNAAGMLNTSVNLTISPVVTAVTAVAAGYIHSCAVVNGGVQCWGANSQGQLGNNSITNSPVPVQTILAGSNATAVSAATSFSCAVVNGGVQCWGANFYGQLGNNSTMQSRLPVQTIAAGSNVTAMSAGGGHNCAWSTAGCNVGG